MAGTASALATLLAYMAILIGVGVWAARRTRSEADYLIAGRSLGPMVSGLAYAASTSSAWVLLGFSGFVYAVGVSALWMVPGILAGYAAIWLFAGPVLQRAAAERGHVTFTDFLSGDASPLMATLIRAAASIMIAFCFAYYVASQFQGAGVAFQSLFGMSLAQGVWLGAGLILLYVFLGGFLAVSVINTLQGLLMAMVAVWVPVAALVAVGGWGGVADGLTATPDRFLDPLGGHSAWIGLGFILGLTATGFGALGQPHLAAFIMASRSRRARMAGAGIALGWGALVYSGMAILGLSARVLLGPEAAGEDVFFRIAADLLPPVLAGLIMAATLSAIMSTVDSQLLVAGAALAHDLRLKSWFGNRAVLAARAAIVLVASVAVALTLALPATIFDRTLFAWTALGASFGPVVVARAMGRVPAGAAVLASILLGFSASLGFEFLWPPGPGAVWARTLPWIVAALPLLMPRKPQ